MTKLYQPILGTTPEPGHAEADVLTLAEFLDLLREEEDYFQGEQNNTKLMITRLRKIFYDQWGWNSELIRGAAKIEGRYVVKIVDAQNELYSKKIRRYYNGEYQPKYRLVTYRENDRVYGNSRVGQVPFIYKNDHQEVRLPDNNMCDIAHILAGLDAYNYFEPVSPLPNFLMFLNSFFPHVDSNVDIVTWLGDIASSSGDFLLDYLKNEKKAIGESAEQLIINRDAPASDMLGDIDPYVIAQCYQVSTNDGKRVSDIIQDYYCESNSFRKKRFFIYCKAIGLKEWNGNSFSNESEWIRYYVKQLRDNITFQVFSLTKHNFASIARLIRIWFGGYELVLKKELLLQIFLTSLKNYLKAETNENFIA
jgi:hypothetical protein